MKVLAVARIHGALARLRDLQPIIEQEKPDLVAVVGNLILGSAREEEWRRARREKRQPNPQDPDLLDEEKQDQESLEALFDYFGDLDRPVALIPGPADAPAERFSRLCAHYQKTYPQLRCVHGAPWQPGLPGGVTVAGVGGRLVDQDPEQQFRLRLTQDQAEAQLGTLSPNGPLILLLYSLPKGRPAETGRLGNPIATHLIQRAKPQLVLCGDGGPGTYQIDQVRVVCPGSLEEGDYALLDFPKGAVELRSLGSYVKG